MWCDCCARDERTEGVSRAREAEGGGAATHDARGLKPHQTAGTKRRLYPLHPRHAPPALQSGELLVRRCTLLVLLSFPFPFSLYLSLFTSLSVSISPCISVDLNAQTKGP
eukprot:TRINITY_DN1944_c0_g2_i2.p3 TRINITY_DN1944_c0_g2~~TRINITY_DN1944_c0_g2_i2.p3  ORF type:complete len:110 (-),score=5.82 TRINITY_DN1944_c0_g2_i2:238-567(-)